MYFIRFPDGKRKALTLSYDDGVEQDERLIGILRQHGLKATFNLNSGCFPADDVVWTPGTIHRRMPLSRCLEVYAGEDMEVAAHGLIHASLGEMTAPQVIHEIMADRENLERFFGGLVRGMAYAFGRYSDTSLAALRATGIAYARTVNGTHRYEIPTDWLLLDPTCHHNDPQLPQLTDAFLTGKPVFDSWLFYLWGHSYEFEAGNNWQVIEDFAAKAGGHQDVWYATNMEIVDYINAARSLIASADGRTLYNPTVTPVWLTAFDQEVCIEPGQTIRV